MKKFITIFLCVFVFGSFFGQQSMECATVENTTLDPTGYSYSSNANDIANFAPRVYNVKYYVLRKDDGSGNTFVTEAKLLEGIANLNIQFNQFNIFFKYRGFEDLNSTLHYKWETIGEFTTALNYAKSIGKNDPNAINVYVPWSYAAGGVAERLIATNIGLPAVNVTRGTFVHEMGHCFNLMHMDSSGNNCENVTRDPNNTNFNADTRGDRVVDTPATRLLNSSDIDTSTCLYVGNYTDCSTPPQTYLIFEPDVRNFLMRGTYIDEVTCAKNYLTQGQGIRMLETIEIDASTNNILSAAETTVASLYEPYAGGYYGVGSIALPLFQPGFDYHFVTCDCDCEQPSPYGDAFSWSVSVHDKIVSKYETDYSTIFHPNHTAIIINSFQNADISYLDPQRCYDNDSGFFKSGKVTRFNDGVFNANVTITPKDSLGINNVNLIQELPNGLYNIEKNYLDGSADQTVIQKGNN